MHSRPSRAPARRIALALCVIALLALIPAAASAARHHHRQAHARHAVSVTASIRAARRRSNRADRRLVSQARGAAALPALRRELQAPARGTSSARAAPSPPHSGPWPCACATPAATTAPSSSGLRKPPTLRASGYKLSWSSTHAQAATCSSARSPVRATTTPTCARRRPRRRRFPASP